MQFMGCGGGWPWLVLGLSGCDTLGLALGTRMRLSDVPVRALSLHLAPQPAMSRPPIRA